MAAAVSSTTGASAVRAVHEGPGVRAEATERGVEVGSGRGAPLQLLQAGVEHGERRAQLVARIRDEGPLQRERGAEGPHGPAADEPRRDPGERDRTEPDHHDADEHRHGVDVDARLTGRRSLQLLLRARLVDDERECGGRDEQHERRRHERDPQCDGGGRPAQRGAVAVLRPHPTGPMR
jgi:hypothetical protein